MTSAYRVGKMDEQLAFQAFGLVQILVPDFPPAQWAQLVRDISRWSILVLEDRAGYVRGLATYRIGTHAIAGRLLDVPMFIVGSAVDDDAIADAIFRSLRRRSAGCDYIRIWNVLPKNRAELDDEVRFSRWDHGLMIRVDQKPLPALL
ncbi:hypothetical protein [Hyphomicrobiales bacterium]|uniref:hypothetical protein n=1 Tax=Rhizobium sp. Rhizsp82 TaxID=3243057 RepID=UPI0011D148B3